MLDAIASLGRLTFDNDPEKLIYGLVRKQTPRDKEQHYYVELHFSTTGAPFRVEVKQYAMHDPFETPRKLHYVGIVPASGLQFHATGHDLRHFCSQVLPALMDKFPSDSPLYSQIHAVLNRHFVLDESIPKDRYRYLLNIESLSTVKEGFTNEIIRKVVPKERPVLVAKAIHEYLQQRFFVPEDHILLYTVCIDEQLVASHPDYIQAVLDDQVSMFSKANVDICYLTGRRESVSADLTKFRFKYYITDKINFSSGISGRFESNFQLSRGAVWRVLLGERFIMNHLRLRTGDFQMYLIPEFLDSAAYDLTSMKETIGKTTRQVKKLNSLKLVDQLEKQWIDEQQNLKDIEGLDTRILLHFLFYEENKNEMKVFRHVKDVSPSYLALMEQARKKTIAVFKRMAPHYQCYGPSFEGLYYYLPLELDSKNKVKNPQQLMQLYDAMLSGRPVDSGELIRSFMRLLASLRHGAFGSLHVKRKWKMADNEEEAEHLWCRINWEQQQFISWLQRIGIIKGGAGNMREAIAAISGRLEKERLHLQESGFNEAQAALFLLGCAINKIADAQEIELKNRAIMRKINFRGMSFAAAQKLATEVFEKGLQYKNTMKTHRFLGKFEMYYQEMSRLFDLALQQYAPGVEKKIDGSKLNDSEIVYHIISGYAFANAQKATAKSAESDLSVAMDSLEENEIEGEENNE